MVVFTVAVVVSFVILGLARQKLERNIVAVLLRVEQTPSILKRFRNLGSTQSAYVGIAIGKVPAGDFVVTLIDETRRAQQLGIYGCGNVAALRQDADGLVGRVAVVGIQVEQPRRI